MIFDNITKCPICKGTLKYYDKVSRIVRTKGGIKRTIRVRRLKCVVCRKLHRELPRFIFPYKQYEADIITGVIDRLITTETLGFEDYPCEMTMNRWMKNA